MAEQIGAVSIGVEVDAKAAQSAIKDLREGFSKLGGFLNTSASAFRLLENSTKDSNKELSETFKRLGDVSAAAGLASQGLSGAISVVTKVGPAMIAVLGPVGALTAAVVALGAAFLYLSSSYDAKNLGPDFDKATVAANKKRNELIDEQFAANEERNAAAGRDTSRRNALGELDANDSRKSASRSKAKQQAAQAQSDWMSYVDEQTKVYDQISAEEIKAAKDAEKGWMDFVDEQTASYDRMSAQEIEASNKIQAQSQAKTGIILGGLESVAGNFGAIANAFTQGLSSGGPIAGLIAAGVALASQTEGFRHLMSRLSNLFGRVVEAINPLVEAVLPALTSIMNSVGEILKPLAEVIAAIAPLLELIVDLFFSKIIGALKLFAAALRIVEPVIKKLSDLIGKLVGGIKKVFGKIGDALNAITFGLFGGGGGGTYGYMKEIEKAKKQSDKNHAKPVNDLTMAFKDLGQVVKETAKEFSEVLTNVPTGLKVALARFNASSAAPVGGGFGSGTVNIGTVEIKSDNPEKIWEGLKKVMDRENFHRTGTPIQVTPRFA